MSRSRQKQIILMEEMKIEEEEYVALLGLMLWNQSESKESLFHCLSVSLSYSSTYSLILFPDFDESDPTMELLVKNMRELIFRQLEAHYKSKGIPSYAERLGALMSIHGTVLVDVYRMKEDMELYNLMSALKADHVMWESLKSL